MMARPMRVEDTPQMRAHAHATAPPSSVVGSGMAASSSALYTRGSSDSLDAAPIADLPVHARHIGIMDEADDTGEQWHSDLENILAAPHMHQQQAPARPSGYGGVGVGAGSTLGLLQLEEEDLSGRDSPLGMGGLGPDGGDFPDPEEGGEDEEEEEEDGETRQILLSPARQHMLMQQQQHQQAHMHASTSAAHATPVHPAMATASAATAAARTGLSSPTTNSTTTAGLSAVSIRLGRSGFGRDGALHSPSRSLSHMLAPPTPPDRDGGVGSVSGRGRNFSRSVQMTGGEMDSDISSILHAQQQQQHPPLPHQVHIPSSAQSARSSGASTSSAPGAPGAGGGVGFSPHHGAGGGGGPNGGSAAATVRLSRVGQLVEDERRFSVGAPPSVSQRKSSERDSQSSSGGGGGGGGGGGSSNTLSRSIGGGSGTGSYSGRRIAASGVIVVGGPHPCASPSSLQLAVPPSPAGGPNYRRHSGTVSVTDSLSTSGGGGCGVGPRNHTPSNRTRPSHRAGQLSWGGGSTLSHEELTFMASPPSAHRGLTNTSVTVTGSSVGGGAEGGTAGGVSSRNHVHVVRIKQKGDLPAPLAIVTGNGTEGDLNGAGSGGIDGGGAAGTPSGPHSKRASPGGTPNATFNSRGVPMHPARHRAHGNYKMPNIPFYKNQNHINRTRGWAGLGTDAQAAGAGGVGAHGGGSGHHNNSSKKLHQKNGEVELDSDAEEAEEARARGRPLGPTRWHARIDTPLYRADGELDPFYVARRARHRQRVVLRSFFIYSWLYLLVGGPYLLFGLNGPQKWSVNTADVWPTVMRVATTLALLLAALAMRWRHARDRVRYRSYLSSLARNGAGGGAAGGGRSGNALPAFEFFPTDSWCGLLVCASGLVLMLMESLRDRRFINSSSLLQDGLLLQLTLVYTYMCTMLRLGLRQLSLQLLVMLAAFNAFSVLFLVHPSEGDNEAERRGLTYMMQGDAFQVLLLVGMVLYRAQLVEFNNRFVDKQRHMYLERRKADRLLRSMLPGSVYRTVMSGANPYLSGIATIGFCNVELSYDDRYTPSPAELMQRLHDTFKRIDGIVAVYAARGVQKVETVSKTYLLCCGLLDEVEDHAASIVDVCLEIAHMIKERSMRGQGRSVVGARGAGAAARNPALASVAGVGVGGQRVSTGLKIGIATGPVVGGIIGTQRRFFRVFGDTVNVSARMCTHSRRWEIQANKYAYDSLNELQRAQYKTPEVRSVEIKGKGSMECYIIHRRDDWIPRYSKAVMNRGKDEEADTAGADATGADVDEAGAGVGLGGGAMMSGSGGLTLTGGDVPRQPRGQAQASTPSFVFHKIVAATHLAPFPLLHYRSAYVHHAPALLRLESAAGSSSAAGAGDKRPSSTGASSSDTDTGAHVEYRYQLEAFHTWTPRSAHIVLWFLLWMIGCVVAVALLQRREWNRTQREAQTVVAAAMAGVDASTDPAYAESVATTFHALVVARGLVDVHAPVFIVFCVAILALFLLHLLANASGLCTRPWSDGSDGGNNSTSSVHVGWLKKHAQIFLSVVSLGIAAWVLVMLHEWGLNGGPIAPHFAFILLHLYVALFLHIQLRFALPIMVASLCAFVAIMVADALGSGTGGSDGGSSGGPGVGLVGRPRTTVNELVFASCYLLVTTCSLVYGCWKGESRVRAHYLVQYALDMEQLQLDAFLNNLLPQFVVNVLKKQAPGRTNTNTNSSKSALIEGAEDGGGGGGGGAGGAAPPARGWRRLLGLGGKSRARNGSQSSSFDSLAAAASPTAGGASTARRRSVFDLGGSPSTLGGGGAALGLSSRFAMHFPQASIFESDIVGYTSLVSNWPAQRTLRMLNELFSMFDAVAEAAGVEKIETIGDAFMCGRFEDEPDQVLDFALDVIANLRSMNEERGGEGEGEAPIEIRSGVCTGSCYGGVIGSDVPRFHLFGPAHDGSILLEQNGRAMTVMVSGATREHAGKRFVFERRPEVQAACEDEVVGEVWQLMGRAGGVSSAAGVGVGGRVGGSVNGARAMVIPGAPAGSLVAAAAVAPPSNPHVVVSMAPSSPTPVTAAAITTVVAAPSASMLRSPSVSVPKSGGWV